MLISPSQIYQAAIEANMKVPPENIIAEDKDFDNKEYPHFTVYCAIQLGVKISWGNHWNNAKIVAAIPESKIMDITYQDLIDLGFDP